MAMAMSASVTVSIGDDRKGVLILMLRVTLDSRLTSAAAKSMRPGSMIMSS